MSNISSTQVKVFPVSSNRLNNTSSRLLYEHNLANIIRQVVDFKNGFIINGPDKVGSTLSSDLEICIYGYYIKILTNTQIVSSDNGEYIVAKLTLDKIETGDNEFIYQLYGQDDINALNEANEFTPLSINLVSQNEFDSLQSLDFIQTVTLDQSEVLEVYLPLYHKVENNYQLYTKSLYKFKPASFQITGIDGKR